MWWKGDAWKGVWGGMYNRVERNGGVLKKKMEIQYWLEIKS